MRNKIKVTIIIIISLIFLFIYYFIILFLKNLDILSFSILNSITLLGIYNISNKLYYFINNFAEKLLKSGLNKNLYEFINFISYSFSLNDLIENIKKFLELKGGFIVAITDNKNILYKSPGRLFEDKDNINKIINIQTNEKIYKIDKNYIFNDNDYDNFGYYLKLNDFNFTIFSHYINLINNDIIIEIYNRLVEFNKRRKILEKMYEISSKTHEWELLAEIQNSFLNINKPSFKDIDVTIKFKPLVNVSGDYFDIIKVNEEKTLFIIGDVSGKGLSASLLTVIVLNTLRLYKDKPLYTIIKEIDRNIKDMDFEDKYTTLIICSYNHNTNILEIVNAAMPSIFYVKNNNINKITSNLPMLGLIDLPEIKHIEIKFDFNDIIFLGSDGVFEANNGNIEYEESGNLDKILLNKFNNIEELSEKILKDLEDFMIEQKDDITFMIIKRR